MMRAAHRVMQRAADNAPVADPELDPDPNVTLKDSGRIEVERRSVLVIFETPYAAKQEFKQHYLSNALKAEIPQLERIFASAIRKAL